MWTNEYQQTRFPENISIDDKGHQFKIYEEHASKLRRVTTLSKRIVDDWNALPPEIVKSKSILTFKNKMDAYWGDVM